MRRLWRDYSLGIVYVAGWLLTWALHAAFTYWAGTYPHDAVPWQLEWLETSAENLASEYHQVGAFILLARWFVFKDSPQSRDSDDRHEGKTDEILQRLKVARIGGE